jgi:hypothetical protein
VGADRRGEKRRANDCAFARLFAIKKRGDYPLLLQKNVIQPSEVSKLEIN